MGAYAERPYRDMIATLRRTATPCWRGCGQRATTPDHVPALARHQHVPGSGCCVLMPSCAPCNLRAGARLGNRARAGRRPHASRRW